MKPSVLLVRTGRCSHLSNNLDHGFPRFPRPGSSFAQQNIHTKRVILALFLAIVQCFFADAFRLRPSIPGLVTNGPSKICCRGYILVLFQTTTAIKLMFYHHFWWFSDDLRLKVRKRVQMGTLVSC